MRNILAIIGLSALLTGCASGVNSRLIYEHRENGIWTRATVEIPSTITASNLVVVWTPMTGEVSYKADWVTRSNEGVVKLTSDRDVRILDSTGKVIGVISEGVMKGLVEGAKFP